MFGLAAAAYLALCVSVLRHSLVWLLGYVADDAFYYLQIARHLAASGHSTFDGLNPTNGYHPGWMLLMTACAKIFPNRVMLLKASLGVEFAFHFATSMMVVAIVRRTDPFWAWIAGAVWLLNPLPFTLALYGVEAPFAQFAVSVCVWTYLVQAAPFLRRGAGRPPVRPLILFGLSLALAFYGRTDQMLLAVLACMMVFGLVWTRTPGRRGRDAVRAALWIGGAFAAGVLPWYVFSFLSCGTLTQDSGTMKMLWHARSIPGWNIHTLVSGPLRFTLLFWLTAPFSALLTGSFGPHLLSPLVFLLALGLTAAGIWAGSRRALPPADGNDAEDALIQVTVWLGAAALISGYLYGALIGDAQFWHLSVPSISLFLLLACWAARAARRQRKPEVQKRAGLAVFAAALGLCIWHQRVTPAPYPWQRDVYASEPRFEAMAPAAARIGSFDAGIPAYFSPRMVINLDGLVNHTAAAYWKTNTLDQYVAAQNIQYIANEPATMAHAQKFTALPIPLTLVAASPLRGWSTGERCFWKVGPQRQAKAAR